MAQQNAPVSIAEVLRQQDILGGLQGQAIPRLLQQAQQGASAGVNVPFAPGVSEALQSVIQGQTGLPALQEMLLKARPGGPLTIPQGSAAGALLPGRPSIEEALFGLLSPEQRGQAATKKFLKGDKEIDPNVTAGHINTIRNGIETSSRQLAAFETNKKFPGSIVEGLLGALNPSKDATPEAVAYFGTQFRSAARARLDALKEVSPDLHKALAPVFAEPSSEPTVIPGVSGEGRVNVKAREGGVTAPPPTQTPPASTTPQSAPMQNPPKVIPPGMKLQQRKVGNKTEYRLVPIQ